MIVSVASYKGGVGKTTTAIHLAAYLNRSGPTILIDGDPNLSASHWAAEGKIGFPVATERHRPRFMSQYIHVVFDTQARPGVSDMISLAKNSDLIVVPTTADALALRVAFDSARALTAIGASWRFLLTAVAPLPSRDAEEARTAFTTHHFPCFRHHIPRLVAFHKAALAGVLVSDVRDRRADIAWSAYCAVGKEL